MTADATVLAADELDDPLAPAVRDGLTNARDGENPPEAVLKLAAQLNLEPWSSSDDDDPALAKLLDLIRRYPSDRRLQILAARRIERSGTPERALKAWEGIERRFPGTPEAFRLLLRWSVRQIGVSAALGILHRRFPALPETLQGLSLYAAGCEELNLKAEVDRAQSALLARFPDKDESYLLRANTLRARGHHSEALEVLRNASTRNPRVARLAARLRGELMAVQRTLARPLRREENQTEQVLDWLVQQIAEQRSNARRTTSYLGHVSMLNAGTLGPGGAERQLSTLAISLNDAARQGRRFAHCDVIGPVEVWCRSLRQRKDGDFFLAPILASGVEVIEYQALPAAPTNGSNPLAGTLDSLLPILPPPMTQAIQHTTRWLELRPPEIAHLWQDSSIFTLALPALMAGIPRLLLSVRSTSPADRPQREQLGYRSLLRALLRCRGVLLSSNSAFAARSYARWLDMDPAEILVIHNGVSPLPTTADPETLSLLAGFDAASGSYCYTLGGVLRLDENKRPLLWIRIAARLSERVPGCRFLLVGDGPLADSCRELASRLGIADRLLFVGRSSSVGFWLSQCDSLLLSSRFEGLPNVAIEAQLAGVPVVTTDAGGAAEAVLNGETGHVLPMTQDEDELCEAAVTRLEELARQTGLRRAMGGKAKIWAEREFSIDRMVEATVAAYAQ